MESFHWDNNFVTGLPEVDQQHHHLVDLINRFGSLLSESVIKLNDIEAVFSELADYANYHFQEEEKLMEHVAIDQRHYQPHVEAHQAFLAEVSLLHEEISADNVEPVSQLLSFLTHWLAYHILGMDQNMARQIEMIKSGVSPTEAFEAEERKSGPSTEPLLHALGCLFNQVTARNRELIQLNQSLEEKVAQRTRELSEANKHLEELSLTDVLTGLPNRRHALRHLATLWDESTEANTPLVCMMIDADHFKEVNDAYGHDAGDQVLVELGKTLLHSMRNDDVVCRLGGDEFFIICPSTDLAGGMHIAELMREVVSQLRVPTGSGVWEGSISVGVAARSLAHEHYEALIKAADEGVYAAKQDGKNCVRTVSGD